MKPKLCAIYSYDHPHAKITSYICNTEILCAHGMGRHDYSFKTRVSRSSNAAVIMKWDDQSRVLFHCVSCYKK